MRTAEVAAQDAPGAGLNDARGHARCARPRPPERPAPVRVSMMRVATRDAHRQIVIHPAPDDFVSMMRVATRDAHGRAGVLPRRHLRVSMMRVATRDAHFGAVSPQARDTSLNDARGHARCAQVKDAAYGTLEFVSMMRVATRDAHRGSPRTPQGRRRLNDARGHARCAPATTVTVSSGTTSQ